VSAPAVAIAHVRRVALDAVGEQISIDAPSAFPEIAMYVPVRLDGRWRLAADQKTPVRAKP
jgi:hypothetical protein